MAIDRNPAALNYPDWLFSREFLPAGIYLVGGAVRDALLGRCKESWDLDFVLPQGAIETARRLARHYHGGFVVLDPARQIARVVFPDGTADFAQQEGDSLEQDLGRRDFTINAIAYCLESQRLIDPLGGLQDLETGTIRMISAQNLRDDPLRLLRAYRLAAQLGFAIAQETRQTIRELAPLLGTVAAERVQMELGYLLEKPEGTPWIGFLQEDRLLSPWLGPVSQEQLEQLARVDDWGARLLGAFPEFNQENWAYLAKLTCLVCPDPETAEAQLLHLKFSRAELKAIVTARRFLPQFLAGAASMSLRGQYFLFLEVGAVFPVLALLALANGAEAPIILPWLERYFNPQDLAAHPQPLIGGKTLIEALDLKPGPKIGELLTEIQIARLEQRITTPKEAIAFAATQLKKELPS